MALKFTGLRFQPLMNLDLLNALNIKQLKEYLKREQEDIQELQSTIAAQKLTISNELNVNIPNLNIEESSIDFANEKASLISQIQAAREQKLMLVSTYNNLIDAKNSISKAIRSNYTAPREGGGAHEAYGRVMNGLTHNAEELRETWDSDDVLTIDDIAIQEGISYDQALAKFKYHKEKTTAVERGQAPTEDE